MIPRKNVLVYGELRRGCEGGEVFLAHIEGSDEEARRGAQPTDSTRGNPTPGERIVRRTTAAQEQRSAEAFLVGGDFGRLKQQKRERGGGRNRKR